MKNEIKYWVYFAEKDLAAAKSLSFDSDDFFSEQMSFLCQQSIEKYFKAFLIENNWKLEKTHELYFLYCEIKKIKDLDIDSNLLLNLDRAYIGTRYPNNYIKLTRKDVNDFISLAEQVKTIIEKELGITSEQKTKNNNNFSL